MVTHGAAQIPGISHSADATADVGQSEMVG